jgi:hypothetical protein
MNNLLFLFELQLKLSRLLLFFGEFVFVLSECVDELFGFGFVYPYFFERLSFFLF